MSDSRIAALSNYVRTEWSTQRKLILLIGSILFSFVISYWVFDSDKYPVQSRGLFILMLAALLWITESIPNFAVSFMIIGYSIYFLDDWNPSTINPEWKTYVSQWSSTVMWLFIGGFMLAEAAHKTKFDRFFSGLVITRFGTKPRYVLLGVMLTTGVLSMFISNTATTVMMLAIVQPVLASLKLEDPFRKAVLLGIAASATLCGMGTIIGSAPNAIAVGNKPKYTIAIMEL